MRSKIYDYLRSRTSRNRRKWFKQQKWFTPVTKLIFGSSVYSAGYYHDVERIERKSVPVIAGWIASRLMPKRVLDVGCGPGHMMVAMAEQGLQVFGIDISKDALSLTRNKGMDCQYFDLTGNDPLPGIPYDLAVSCEVAEHLPPEAADVFVAKLTESAPVVYLTAAEPSEGKVGLHHFNEQPNQYWIEKFQTRGFCFDAECTRDARETLVAGGVISYLAKPMIFKKQD
jgi:SAM-dependent methyltransferase